MNVMFPDAASKDDRIATAHQPAVAPDCLTNTADEDGDSELCILVALGCGLTCGEHVVGKPRERGDARIVVQKLLDLIQGLVAVAFHLAQQIKNQAGIEISW